MAPFFVTARQPQRLAVMNTKTEKGQKARKRFVIESIALFLIIITPFAFKIHEYLPTDPEQTISFLGIEIGRNGFRHVSAHVWFVLGKAIPLYLIIIWFFTCKHWWYHILLIPICMYAFQIFEIYHSSSSLVDKENILWILPVCMLVIPFVYFIRVKLYDKHVHGIDLAAMDAELQYYRDKENNELKKAGITLPKDFSAQEEKGEEQTDKSDLTEKLPKSILSRLLSQLRHSFQSIF